MRCLHRVFSCLLVAAASHTALAAMPAECWMLRKHGHSAGAQTCFEALTQSREAYARAEGLWGLEDWTAANEQFRLATQPASSPALYKVRWGTLLHERFNNREAVDLLHEVLAKDPGSAAAYLGLATVSMEGFDGKAMEYTAKAISLEPRLAAAHELMANLALDNDDRVLAAAEADQALALEADALDAMAIRAALELIADRPPDVWFRRIAAVNAAYGAGYAQVAHHLELHYRFADAEAYYQKAVEVDPRLWSAHASLGIAMMRLGESESAFKELELSYNNGFRNLATQNSLRLLESYKNFEKVKVLTAGTPAILKLHRSEAELLRPYVEAELGAILPAYEAKYQMKLPGPVQVELYPDHEDFAVRTMGMPGLGAQGVTFNQVVAMDSPSARKPGDFNWGATLWHEMSHVFVITATHGRVPRWFTEGLAVHEEGEHAPEWSDRLTPEVLLAIRDKKLLPIAKLDRGFVFPEYPSQVIVSYFQAGSICDFIQARWGAPKLLEMVHAFAEVKPTPQVVEAVLGLPVEAFDREYLAWLDKRYGAQAAHFDAWREGLRKLVLAAKAQQLDTVRAEGPALLALYPEYVGEANVYELLAESCKGKGDADGEMRALLGYEHAGGESPSALTRLAALEEAAKQPEAAAGTLGRLNYVYPVKSLELHQHLGKLLYEGKHYDAAIREYRAVLASAPLDKAGAEFQLAQAYMAAGHRDKAEESVLLALEAAPGYRPAQKLLLELNQDSPQKN